MESYINLYAARILSGDPERERKMRENDVDVYDPRYSFQDDGKSYVSNPEIYSSLQYFDAEKWFEGCGV